MSIDHEALAEAILGAYRRHAALQASAPDFLEVAKYAKDIHADVLRGAIDPMTALNTVVELADAAIDRLIQAGGVA